MKISSTKKPWGGFKTFTNNEKSTVKILTINPKQKISLQRHKKRSEFWFFLDNPAKVTIGKKVKKFKKGDSLIVRRNTLHRIEGLSKIVNVLEISFGKFEEGDILRVEDIYGRIKK